MHIHHGKLYNVDESDQFGERVHDAVDDGRGGAMASDGAERCRAQMVADGAHHVAVHGLLQGRLITARMSVFGNI